MKEYVTEAFVLRKEPRGEFDERVIFYAKELGCIEARVVGGRRIHSKLSGHLEPPNLVQTRLVYKRSFTVADALLRAGSFRARADTRRYRELQQLFRAVIVLEPRNEPNPRLWHTLYRAAGGGRVSCGEVLRMCGYDPRYAECSVCGMRPFGFFLADQLFFCRACAFRFPEREVILLYRIGK